MFDAVTLDACLRSVSSSSVALPNGFSKAFFSKKAPRIEGMWNENKGFDYGWSTTTPVAGETLNQGSFGRKLGRQINRLCRNDPEAYAHLWHVIMMLAPPTDLLFTPWFTFRLAKQWLFG